MKKKTKKSKEIEVTRSFSLKISLGNYEMAEFFACQNAYCLPKDVEKVSETLHFFVKSEVIKSVNQFKAGLNQPKAGPIIQGHNKFELKDYKNEVREDAMMN